MKLQTIQSHMLLEATNSIRAMHEIESILNNDDIPADSRSYFLQFITVSLHQTLSEKQQKNVTIFRELFVRIDKDIRLFRTFLDMAVDLAHYFKFENTSLVYAFKNVSLEEHFTSFVDFARRKNPIIDKNSPLQLFLTMGIAIIRLALQKTEIESNKESKEQNKKILAEQYRELSRNMSKRFINMDFGADIVEPSTGYTCDLDDFNNDDDGNDTDFQDTVEVRSKGHTKDCSSDTKKDCCDGPTIRSEYKKSGLDGNGKFGSDGCKKSGLDELNKSVEKGYKMSVKDLSQKSVDISTKTVEAVLKNFSEEDILEADYQPRESTGVTITELQETTPVAPKESFTHDSDSDIPSLPHSILSLDLNEDIDEIINDILETSPRETDDHDSGIVYDENDHDDQKSDDIGDKIFTRLENGDKELNLNQLDSLVAEAGRKFGPAVLDTLSKAVGTDKKEPMVRFTNPSVQNIVDFIKH